MRIADITTPELVYLDVPWSSKDEVISNLVSSLAADGAVTDEAAFKKAVMEREAHGPTGLEDGLAIPHGKSEAVAGARVAMARLSSPIADWESVMPGNEVDLVFMLAIPDAEAGSTHLKVLSTLSTRFMDADAREAFMSAQTDEEFIAALEKSDVAEEATAPAAAAAAAGAGAGAATGPGEAAAAQGGADEGQKLVLGITSCASGIAHTYMAATALEKAGEELGVNVLVEKQGASGIEDRHTREQIKEADAVVFAVDVAVKERERYAGKPFVQTKVAEPLRRAPEIVTQALENPDGVVAGDASGGPPEGEEELSVGAEITQAILTGISYMIPVIVAGGVLMGVAKLAWQYGLGLDVQLMTQIPEDQWTLVQEFLIRMDQFGGLVFTFMYPVFALYAAVAIGGRVAVVGGLMGGVLAAGVHYKYWGIEDAIPSGFLGALVLGIGAGYLAKFLNEKIKVSQHIAALKPMLLIPAGSIFVIFVANQYLVDPFFNWLNAIIYDAILSMPVSQTLALSAVIAAATAFDLGGPVNKAAGAVAIGLAADGVFPLTPRVLAIVIPPMGMGLAVIIDTYLTKRDLFEADERVVGQTSFLLSFLGISEGAIPFMLRNPVIVIPINIIGAVIGACTAVYLGAVQWLPLPAIWGWPLVSENLWAYLLGMFLGAGIIALLYTIARTRMKTAHVKLLADQEAEAEEMEDVEYPDRKQPVGGGV